jgi:hypothetical protein
MPVGERGFVRPGKQREKKVIGTRRRSGSSAELDGHFVFSITQWAGADDLAEVFDAFEFDPAGQADGERVFEDEGQAAERQIARHDVENGIGAGPVEDGEDGAGLQQAAVFAPSITAGEGGASGRRGRDGGR